MANIKSAEKRIKQTAKKNARNRSVRTKLRTVLKSHRSADASGRAKQLPGTFSEIDTALKKGVIHKNAAARYKSRLAKQATAKA